MPTEATRHQDFFRNFVVYTIKKKKNVVKYYAQTLKAKVRSYFACQY